MFGLFPVSNTDFTIFNIFCTAFLSMLWNISLLCLTDLHRNNPWQISVFPSFFNFGFWLGLSKKFSNSSLQQLHNFDKVVKEIPKEKYENIIKGTYNRTKKYHKKPSNRRKTLKNYL